MLRPFAPLEPPLDCASAGLTFSWPRTRAAEGPTATASSAPAAEGARAPAAVVEAAAREAGPEAEASPEAMEVDREAPPAAASRAPRGCSATCRARAAPRRPSPASSTIRRARIPSTTSRPIRARRASCRSSTRACPRGADMCNCGALFKSGAVVSTTTGVDGSFCADERARWEAAASPRHPGRQVAPPLPHQRDVLPGQRADGQLASCCCRFGRRRAGDTDDNMPDIAVSTGEADTLECLMKRIGLPDTEYVAGAGGQRAHSRLPAASRAAAVRSATA